MPANRRRHINALPGMKLLVGFFAGALVLLCGLGYVYCQNQLHRLSDEIGRLEKEYENVQSQSKAVQVSISKLSATPELQKKRENGFFTKLTEIKEENILMIPAASKGAGVDEKQLRPVSNGRGKP